MSAIQDWACHKFPNMLAAFFLATLSIVSALAQTVPGVTRDSIWIGSCSALNGHASFLGKQTVLGASAYLRMVNDKGGVHGRKIRLLSFDDGYDPDKAPTCFRRMMKEGVFVLGFFVGTPTAAKYLPLAEAERVPVVGLFTGAQMLYEPLKHYVINVRASYYDETREQIKKLWETRGVHRIGVVYQDDAFGKAVLDGVKLALQEYHSAPVALGTFPRGTLSVEPGLKIVLQAVPEAVIMVGPYASVAEVAKQIHASGATPLLLTVSFVGTEQFIKEAGPDAEGTIITQVVPPYDRTDLPTVALYRQTLEKFYPDTPPSFVSLEGFVDAMVLVEGLKRAGRELTREKLVTAIESIHQMDVGLGSQLLLNYGPKNHKGFVSVYDTMVQDGKPVVLKDWKSFSR
jgi:branched-chain amino acid transport system substrate-binding protein